MADHECFTIKVAVVISTLTYWIGGVPVLVIFVLALIMPPAGAASPLPISDTTPPELLRDTARFPLFSKVAIKLGVEPAIGPSTKYRLPPEVYVYHCRVPDAVILSAPGYEIITEPGVVVKLNDNLVTSVMRIEAMCVCF